MEQQITVSRVLIDARTLLQHGWCQHGNAMHGEGDDAQYCSPLDPIGPDSYCASGAIIAAISTLRVRCGLPTMAEEAVLDDQLMIETQAHHVLQRFLYEDGHNYGQPVPSWNDKPERTQSDVLAAFDRAIAYTWKGDKHV